MYNKFLDEIRNIINTNGIINIAVDCNSFQIDTDFHIEGIYEDSNNIKLYCSNILSCNDFSLVIKKDSDLKYDENLESYMINYKNCILLITL